MRHRTRQDSGFTLVELLVALSVMALIAVLGQRALDGMVRTQTRLAERAEQVLALQAALGQWEADLAALYETRVLSALDWDGRALRLTRRDALQPETLRVVAWGQRDIDGRLRWLRWQSPPLRSRGELDQAWLQAQAWARNPGEAARRAEITVTDIDGWQLFYFRNNAWTNPLSAGAENAGTGPATATTLAEVPEGVRLQLDLAATQPLAGRIVRDWVRPTLGGGKS